MKALSNAAPSSLKGAAVEKPNISFDDIGGLEAVKAELKELVTMPVQYADDYEAMGQKVSVQDSVSARQCVCPMSTSALPHTLALSHTHPCER